MTMSFAKRIGIMGGTFDPIHIGHLVAAEEAYQQFNLDKVIFMPAGRPAFKLDQEVTSAEHRLMMAQLATASNPHFEVSDLEVQREGVTYTIDTVRILKEKFPRAELYFITGADAVFDIITWKDSAELAHLVTFIATTRPGYDAAEAQRQHEASLVPFSIHWIEVPALSVSSSDLRARLREGRSVRYLTARSVLGYLAKHELYSATDGELYDA